jgi:hypothetical protein
MSLAVELLVALINFIGHTLLLAQRTGCEELIEQGLYC